MKKNISFIYMDSVLTKWLCTKLADEPPDSGCVEELLTGIQDLTAGKIEMVALGIPENPDAFSGLDDGSICTGDIVICPKRRKVLLKKTEISLTPKEFDILYFLARNRGTVFTKEQIYRAVWGQGVLFTDSNIMAFIRKLRKKIEKNSDIPEYILTVWGIGYKFNDCLDE